MIVWIVVPNQGRLGRTGTLIAMGSPGTLSAWRPCPVGCCGVLVVACVAAETLALMGPVFGGNGALMGPEGPSLPPQAGGPPAFDQAGTRAQPARPLKPGWELGVCRVLADPDRCGPGVLSVRPEGGGSRSPHTDVPRSACRRLRPSEPYVCHQWTEGGVHAH